MFASSISKSRSSVSEDLQTSSARQAERWRLIARNPTALLENRDRSKVERKPVVTIGARTTSYSMLLSKSVSRLRPRRRASYRSSILCDGRLGMANCPRRYGLRNWPRMEVITAPSVSLHHVGYGGCTSDPLQGLPNVAEGPVCRRLQKRSRPPQRVRYPSETLRSKLTSPIGTLSAPSWEGQRSGRDR